MPKQIRNGHIEDSTRHILTLDEGETPESVALPAAGALLVPLAVWQARRAELTGRDAGVWLSGDQDPFELEDDLAGLPVIGVHFPQFVDGRGYSIAVLLRSRLNYRGELLAFGDVLQDQFDYYIRSGFDTLQPPEGRYSDSQLAAAAARLTVFSEPYQASVAHPQPLFRRVRRSV